MPLTRLLTLSLLALPTLALAQNSENNQNSDDKPSIPWRKSYTSALDEARKTHKPIMIDFYTDWCGWCVKLDEDTYSDPSVIKQSRQFIPVKLNAEQSGIPESLAESYHITGFPTILFLDPSSAYDPSDSKPKPSGIVGKIPGYMPPKDFLEELQEIADSYHEFPALSKKFQADPSNITLARRLLATYELRGDAETAGKLITDLHNRKVKANLSPDFSAVADMHQQALEFDRAIPLYQQSLDLARSPADQARARIGLAICHASKGDFEDAVPLLESVSEIDADLPDLKTEAADLLTQVRRFIKLQQLEKARGSANELQDAPE